MPIVQLFDARTRRPADVLAAGGALTYTPDGDPRRPARREALRRRREPAEGLHRATRRQRRIAVADDVRRRRAPAGLDVVAYTFRNENSFLPLELRSSANPTEYGDALAEYAQFFALGVDGVFTDNPDTAKAARDGE